MKETPQDSGNNLQTSSAHQLLRVLVFVFGLGVAATLHAQGTAFTYQGRLNDSGGVASGNYDLTFALFDAASGGAQQNNTITNTGVSVSNGLFAVSLDFGAGTFTGADRWLEIAARTNGGVAFATLNPRQQLTSTPYAILAATAVTASTAASVTAGSISGTLTTAQLPAEVLTNGVTNATLNGVLIPGFQALEFGNGVFGKEPNAGKIGYQTFSDSLDIVGAGTGSNRKVRFYAEGGTVFNGPILATSFSGSVSANQLIGTVAIAQLPGGLVTNGQAGLSLGGAFGSASWGNFPSPTPVNTGFGSSAIATEDFNGDGKPDLVVNGPTGLAVFTNNGAGGFAAAAPVSAGFNPTFLAAADVNGDGKADIICLNESANSVTVLTNNGAGGFAISSTTGVGSVPWGLTVADVNGDNKPDIITADHNSASLTILTNAGSGRFVFSASLPMFNAAFSVAAVDVNGDNKRDLVGLNTGDGALEVYINDGAGNFTLASETFTHPHPIWVTAADVNGDGKMDMITANNYSGISLLDVITNNGSGGFQLSSYINLGTYVNAVIAADVNGDGKMDLITMNLTSSSLTVLTNAGGGNFLISSTVGVGVSPYQAVALDVNGDGHIDLVSANGGSSFLTLLTNSLGYSASFTGNGAALIGLNAGSVTGVLSTVTIPNLDASKITSGTLALARLPATVVTNGAGGVALSGSFSGNGSGLTNLNATSLGGIVPVANLPANLVTNNATGLTLSGAFNGNGGGLTNLATVSLTGTIADARLSANVPLLNGTNLFTGTNRFANPLVATNINNQLAGSFTGNGAGLSNLANLNATSLAAGTVADARLSTNVALRAGGNVFSGNQQVFDAFMGGVESLDQYPPALLGNGWTSALGAWQSFTAGQSGLLTHIALEVGSPLAPASSPGTLNIYAGEGTGGQLLVTESVTYSNVVTTYQSFPLIAPPLLQAGTRYTIQFSAPTVSAFWIYFFSTDAYSNGICSLNATNDLGFKTYITPLTTNIFLTVNPGLSGRIGIGTNLPQATLHVAGDLLANGTVTGNGSGLTNLSASQLVGTVPLPQLPTAVVTNGESGLTLTGAFSGNGAGLTNLNANIALLNGNPQTFTGTNLFASRVGIGTTGPAQLLQVGDDSVALSQGMIRLGSRSSAGISHRAWDIGVPQTGEINTNDGYSFVIRDITGGTNTQFIVRWDNHNVGIGTNQPQQALHVIGNILASGTITGSSDRNVKRDFQQVNSRDVLDKVAALPISTWTYIADDGIRHLGPMAQDFYSAFKVGMDDKHISMVDADGVALAAIQGLNEKVEIEKSEAQARLERLESENAVLLQTVNELKELMKGMRTEQNGGGK